jgi:thioredoxin 1
MSVFLLNFRTAWNDHFPATTTTNLSQQTYTSRPSPSGSNAYVSNCLFKSISSTSGDGGALSLTSVTYFLVESTSFFSCRTSGTYGGAIYFYNRNNGQSVLYEVCGYDCYSNPYALFARIDVNNAASSKNYFNYSSISCCVNENSNSELVLRLIYGKIYCPSINISMNKCVVHHSSICCDPFSDSNSVICSLSYSSFTDNTANQGVCICFWTTGAKSEIKNCNILRNTQVSSSHGTIYTNGYLTIDDSCILENKATYIFSQYSSSYTITLSNCTVDSTSNNGYLTTQNTAIKSFILALNHMSTLNCNSEYDSAGTLTPIMQIPSSSKKQRVYYSFVKCFYQSPLIDFFAGWCGPCQRLGKILPDLAKQYPNADFYKIDIEKNNDAATKFGVRSIPHIVFWKDGKEVHHIVGADVAGIKATIEKHQ